MPLFYLDENVIFSIQFSTTKSRPSHTETRTEKGHAVDRQGELK